MKKTILIAGMLFINYCIFPQKSSTSWACLSQADAEKIIGQPSKLMESESETKNGILKFRCTYTARDTDSKTGKKGNIFYSAKEYPSANAAHDSLASIIMSNRNMPGWKNVTGIGDEAIVHTDKTNFQLVIVRKGNKMVLMKVNKVTAFTAPIETLLSVGQRIAGTF